jgi:hypothetical protein
MLTSVDVTKTTAIHPRLVPPVCLVHDAAHAAQDETGFARRAIVAVGHAHDPDSAVLEAPDHLLLVDLIAG